MQDKSNISAKEEMSFPYGRNGVILTLDLVHLLDSLCLDLDVDTDTRDYLVRRCKSEGLKFLSSVLPSVSKAVVRSLEIGYFDYYMHDGLTSFERRGRSLRYFRSFIDKIFCRKTGVILEDPDAGAIKSLRQLCEYFYKLATPFSEEDENKAISKFLENEKDLASYPYDWVFVDKLRADCENYYPELRETKIHDVLRRNPPRSGPGTFSSRTRDDHWWRKRLCFPRVLNRNGIDIPFWKKILKKPFELLGLPKSANVPVLAEDTNDVTEVLFVPKDSRGPRVISREPFYSLCSQMAFHDWITDYLEYKTYRRVNFRDQSINQQLAERSSVDQSFCTLDLENGSDRVSNLVVRRIYRNQTLVNTFLAYRTPEAVILKDHQRRRIRLKKLSGMGSGFTFPLMAHLISLAITRRILDSPLRRGRSYQQIRSMIYVYGDDIVAPTSWYPYAVDALAKVGLKVNTGKSFALSKFRESCGADFYNGTDVSTVKLRLAGAGAIPFGTQIFLSNLDHSLLQVERHCRQLMLAGLEYTAFALYRLIESTYGISLPYITGDSRVLGIYVPDMERLYVQRPEGHYAERRVLIASPEREYFFGDPALYWSNFLKYSHSNPNWQWSRSDNKVSILAEKFTKCNTTWIDPDDVNYIDSRVSIPRKIRIRSVMVDEDQLQRCDEANG